MTDRSSGSPADYLAAERTFLAWIRTGLALMGFGFVVARFGLFLEALRIGQPNLQLRPFGLSFWFGTALILLGVVVNVLGMRSHLRLVEELKRGESSFARPSSLGIAVAVILAVLGLAMAIYLITVRQPGQVSAGNVLEKPMSSSSGNEIVAGSEYRDAGSGGEQGARVKFSGAAQ
jgi:inner membrane protein YidH